LPARKATYVPDDFGAAVLLPLLDALIASIAEDDALITVQQRVRLRHIADVARGGNERVGQPRLGINPDVRAFIPIRVQRNWFASGDFRSAIGAAIVAPVMPFRRAGQ